MFYPTIIYGGYVVYLYFLWNEIFLLVYVFRGLWYEIVYIPTESNTEYSNVTQLDNTVIQTDILFTSTVTLQQRCPIFDPFFQKIMQKVV